jgi:hypothetical protein
MRAPHCVWTTDVRIEGVRYHGPLDTTPHQCEHMSMDQCTTWTRRMGKCKFFFSFFFSFCRSPRHLATRRAMSIDVCAAMARSQEDQAPAKNQARCIQSMHPHLAVYHSFKTKLWLPVRGACSTVCLGLQLAVVEVAHGGFMLVPPTSIAHSG